MPVPLILAGGVLVTGGIAAFAASKLSEQLRGKATDPSFTRPFTREELLELEVLTKVEESEFERQFKLSQAQRLEEQRRRDEQARLETARIVAAEKQADRLAADLRLRRDIEARREAAALQVLRDRELLEAKARETRELAELKAAIETQAARDLNLARFQAGLPDGFTAAIDPSGTLTAIPPESGLTPSDIAAGVSPLPFASQRLAPVSGLSFRTIPGVYVPPGKTAGQVLAEQFGPRGLREGVRPVGGAGERSRVSPTLVPVRR